MTPLERKLLRCANGRRWCHVSTRLPAGSPANVVYGAFIRRLLVGGVDGHAPAAYSYGVRLRGACIKGIIDLRDCRNSGQGPLPPLLLENCILEGNLRKKNEAVLSARHAVLSRLSLTGCRVGRVDLGNAVIEGDLAVDRVQPLDRQRDCQLSARAVKIRGRLNAQGATFRIGKRKEIPNFGIRDYPVDLADACIDNSVYFYPGFTALGGINLLGAKVDGDIWCHGTHLVSGGSWAFRAQGLTCRGAVSFSSSDSNVTEIDGDIELLGAHISYLTINSVKFHGHSALRAENATVDGNVQISSHLLLDIHLQGVNIGGTLEISDGYVDTRSPGQTGRQLGGFQSAPRDKPILSTQRLEAYGIAIGAGFTLNNFRGFVDISDAEIDGAFEANYVDLVYLHADGAAIKGLVKIVKSAAWSSPSRIDARNLEVGENLILEIPPGTIELHGSSVRNNLHIKFPGTDTAPGHRAAIHANNITVDNNCRFDNTSGIVRLDSCTVGGLLCIQGTALESFTARSIVVHGPTELDVVHTPNRTKHQLDFAGSRFGGGFFIKKLTIMPAIGIDSILSLDNAQIDRNLHVQSVSIKHATADWMLADPVDLIDGAVPYYPGWRLCEATYDLQELGTGFISFLQRERTHQLILLTGSANPIKKLNGSGALQLATDEDVAKYLRFYCNHVWGAAGPLRTIEPPIHAGLRFGTNPAQLPLSAVAVSQINNMRWQCSATVLYESTLYAAKFVVTVQGSVKRLSFIPLADLEHPWEVRIASPLQIVVAGQRRSAAFVHDLDTQITGVSRTVPDPAPLVRRLKPLLIAADRRHQGQGGIISLIGAKASAVRVPEKSAWGHAVQIRLESFQYERLQIDTPVVSAFDTPSWRHWLRWMRWWRLRELRQSAIKQNLDWLYLQFPDGDPAKYRKRAGFSPQPHEHLARLLRSQGKTDEAIAVTLNLLALERKLRLSISRRIVSSLMFVFFRHGLLPGKGLAWCLILMCIGGFYFDYINYGYFRWYPRSEKIAALHITTPILVFDAAAVSPLLKIDAKKFPSGVMIRADAGDMPLENDYRCGEQVDPVLYAIELFVPLLDLKQQDKCTITTDPIGFKYRMVKLLYTIAGSIFTSLTLLSFAGVLRRRVEQ